MRVEGRLIGLFSFDIGDEIRLDDVRTLVREAAAGSLEKRRAAPVHLAYAVPPLHLPLPDRDLLLHGETRTTAATSAWVHEFGAATILLETPLSCEVTALPGLAAGLTGTAPIEEAARGALAELVERIAPAVVRPEAGAAMMEDYWVVQVDRFDPPATIDEVLAAHGPEIAAAVRGEARPLSGPEADEILRGALRYYPEDLLVADWNVAFVVDESWHDAVAILEFLNVQLVELRWYDALLDRRIADVGSRARGLGRPSFLARPLHAAIDELSAVRIDMARIFERIHNSLKLGGDLYLAKVYAQTAQRLGLESWERAVARKLEVVQELSSILSQRAATARAELLEITVIVLIAVEIAISLVGRR
ncbi:MAG: hypothetical protein ACKPBU_06690 [Alphaproteobacteria bacterium]